MKLKPKELVIFLHRPVIKSDSATTKMRPVFDASTKKNGLISIKYYLYKV